jgi:hypothetical protein
MFASTQASMVDRKLVLDSAAAQAIGAMIACRLLESVSCEITLWRPTHTGHLVTVHLDGSFPLAARQHSSFTLVAPLFHVAVLYDASRIISTSFAKLERPTCSILIAVVSHCMYRHGDTAHSTPDAWK